MSETMRGMMSLPPHSILNALSTGLRAPQPVDHGSHQPPAATQEPLARQHQHETEEEAHQEGRAFAAAPVRLAVHLDSAWLVLLFRQAFEQPLQVLDPVV